MNLNETRPEPGPCIGIDFGEGDVVCAYALADGSSYRTLALDGWSREITDREGNRAVHCVPALIQYTDGTIPHIGREVITAGQPDSPSTGRWIRSHVLEESAVRIFDGLGRSITYREAASDFITAILKRIASKCPEVQSFVFSVPAGAPHGYAGLLRTLAQSAGITSCHTIDEFTAAAAGYGLAPVRGDIFVIFSCDETSHGFSVVRCGESGGTGEMGVIGSARMDTGCQTIDTWIAQEIVAKSHIRYHGTHARDLFQSALGCTGSVHSQLSCGNEALAEFSDEVSGRNLSVRLTRDDIATVLSNHGLQQALEETLRRAYGAARAHGYNGETPAAVLMTGRGSAIRAVQEFVRRCFPGIRVMDDRPLDAIARGAALYHPGNPGTDRIRNEYALRYWDPESREYRYRFLVHSGTRFPSAGQVARITISASYDGQSRLGLPIFEICSGPDEPIPALELIQDPSGGVRLAGPDKDTGEAGRPRLANGRTPVLLPADPPPVKGEPRFELTFTIDREKNLCVTARDLLTGELIRRNTPVCQMT